MPVTKTAKRALRGSIEKNAVNQVIRGNLDIAQRIAKKKPTLVNVSKVFSLADRAVKKHTLHRNKAARIKSSFSKLLTSK